MLDLGKPGVFDGVELLAVAAFIVVFWLGCWLLGWWLAMTARRAKRHAWVLRGQRSGRWLL